MAEFGQTPGAEVVHHLAQGRLRLDPAYLVAKRPYVAAQFSQQVAVLGHAVADGGLYFFLALRIDHRCLV
jgi:hypothetical protein